MTTATKTKSKPAQKAAPKSATQPKTLFYATLLAEALTGKYGPELQRFYVNACAYHLKAKTVFPRARLANQPLLNEADAVEFLNQHARTSIPAGSRAGQRLYDEMMAQTAAK